MAAEAKTRTSTSDPELACPISPVVDIVFSRWTTPILWALHTYGRQRFVELERRIAKITPKVLTQRLRQLERDGLVVRTYHPEVPPRVEYEISALGRSLAPSSPTSRSGRRTTWRRSKSPGRRTTPSRSRPSRCRVCFCDAKSWVRVPFPRCDMAHPRLTTGWIAPLNRPPVSIGGAKRILRFRSGAFAVS